jgi:hypothetical protein
MHNSTQKDVVSIANYRLHTHFKSWSVSIYSDEFELKTFSQQPDADQLISHLETNYPNGRYHLAYEAEQVTGPTVLYSGYTK